MRNQRLRAHSSLPMFRESMVRLRKRQFSRDSFTHWAHDAVLIGRMAERGDEVIAMDGG